MPGPYNSLSTYRSPYANMYDTGYGRLYGASGGYGGLYSGGGGYGCGTSSHYVNPHRGYGRRGPSWARNGGMSGGYGGLGGGGLRYSGGLSGGYGTYGGGYGGGYTGYGGYSGGYGGYSSCGTAGYGGYSGLGRTSSLGSRYSGLSGRRYGVRMPYGRRSRSRYSTLSSLYDDDWDDDDECFSSRRRRNSSGALARYGGLGSSSYYRKTLPPLYTGATRRGLLGYGSTWDDDDDDDEWEDLDDGGDDELDSLGYLGLDDDVWRLGRRRRNRVLTGFENFYGVSVRFRRIET